MRLPQLPWTKECAQCLRCLSTEGVHHATLIRQNHVARPSSFRRLCRVKMALRDSQPTHFALRENMWRIISVAHMPDTEFTFSSHFSRYCYLEQQRRNRIQMMRPSVGHVLEGEQCLSMLRSTFLRNVVGRTAALPYRPETKAVEYAARTNRTSRCSTVENGDKFVVL